MLLFEITLGLVGLGLLTLALGVKHLGVRTVRERTVRGLGLVFGVRVGLLSTELVLRLGFWVTVRLGLATGQMSSSVSSLIFGVAVSTKVIKLIDHL